MKPINLTISKESKPLPSEFENSRVYDLTANGIDVMPIKDDFPMPWDAACYIEDGMFIIDGDLGQQGAHKGYAKVGIPLDRVKNYLKLFVSPEDEEAAEELTATFSEYGWL